MNPTPVDGIPAELVTGPDALEQCASLWRALEDRPGVTPFQSHAWASAWVEHLGVRGSPWIVLSSASEAVLWPLFLRRRAGFRVLSLLGDGVSDYLGPLGDSDGLRAAEVLTRCLQANSRHFDLLDLGSLRLAERGRACLLRGLGSRATERVYERCPVIDTAGRWEDYLLTRKKKFRANLKRAVRRVEARGKVEIAVEETTPGLLAELEAVERESWKWENGTAYFQFPGRPGFLETLLRSPQILSELWTCRADGELAGFAVVFRGGATRYYYLPSFRARFSDVGTYLLRQIVRDGFDSPCQEVDLLQGDEAYKMGWASGIREVHELVGPGRSLRAPAAVLGARLRWRLAESGLARRIHSWARRVA